MVVVLVVVELVLACDVVVAVANVAVASVVGCCCTAR